MSIKSDFIALSTTKKAFVVLGFTVLVGLPFQALQTQKEERIVAAQYNAMTPQEREANFKKQYCYSNPKECAKLDDALINLHHSLKAAKDHSK